MNMRNTLVVFGSCMVWSTMALAGPKLDNVNPFTFDPAKSNLVGASWVEGIGCPPANSKYQDYVAGPSVYTDPACAVGDPKDSKNKGLLLSKVGPTGNDAAAGADLKGVKGVVLTELGYDIRKPGSVADPRGSHCGAGAPRFNVQTDVAFYFISGCNSPAADQQIIGNGWIRLRWGGSSTLLGYGPSGGLENVLGTVQSIQIVFDEE